MAAAGAGYAVDRGVLPGRSTVFRRLGLHGPAGRVPDVPNARILTGTLTSSARGERPSGWSIAYPPGAAENLPVAVVLHGASGIHASAFARNELALGYYLTAAVQAGAAPFAFASIDGGGSYWHPRTTGEDSSAMVVDEFLLAKRPAGGFERGDHNYEFWRGSPPATCGSSRRRWTGRPADHSRSQ